MSSRLFLSPLPTHISQHQGRTADAVFQIDKGLDEAKDVGEVVVSKRLRRLRAQVSKSRLAEQAGEGNLGVG